MGVVLVVSLHPKISRENFLSKLTRAELSGYDGHVIASRKKKEGKKMAEKAQDMSIEELEAALAAKKEQRKADRAAEQKARREREREEMEARVAEFRENNVEAWAGPAREWLAISKGWSTVALTVHEGTTPQSGIVLSLEDARKLRDELTAMLG